MFTVVIYVHTLYIDPFDHLVIKGNKWKISDLL